MSKSSDNDNKPKKPKAGKPKKSPKFFDIPPRTRVSPSLQKPIRKPKKPKK